MREHKKLESLMLFSEVAARLSFTQAAEALGISRGYLSEQIKRLEDELGTALLIRSTRHVRLTEDGTRVQEEMRGMRRSLLGLERSLAQDHDSLTGQIRITAPALFTERVLLDIVDAFQRCHPGVSIAIDCSYTRHDLTLADFDLAFRATRKPPDNLVARPLLHYRHLCCAAPDYLAAHGRPATPAALKDHECLPFAGDSEWPFVSGRVAIEGRLAINDHRLLKRECRRGRGIIRVADYLVGRELARGELEEVLADERPAPQTIQLMYPRLNHQPERLKAFIAFTQAHVTPS
ncbi:MAG: LysR family transcriptional regulator [Onishia taeanensis]|uniref:LysR family transcriptional regulator n=1 Tax=Onishia taeanensis TaxID=284577 RepID=UPI003C7E78BC